MTDADFHALAREAFEKFNAMSTEDKASHRREQAISFAYGNAVLSNPAVTREMVEAAYDRAHKENS